MGSCAASFRRSFDLDGTLHIVIIASGSRCSCSQLEVQELSWLPVEEPLLMVGLHSEP